MATTCSLTNQVVHFLGQNRIGFLEVCDRLCCCSYQALQRTPTPAPALAVEQPGLPIEALQLTDLIGWHGEGYVIFSN